MAIDPVIIFTKQNDITIVDESESDTEFLPYPCHEHGVPENLEDFGYVKAGQQTTIHRIHIWNNKDGEEDANPATDLTISTVTLDKENSGGPLCGGKELVETKSFQVKDVSGGSEIFNPVGGLSGLALQGILRGDLLAAPNLPTGTPGHGSGGEVLPGTYYGCVSALDETGETLAGAESAGVEIEPLFEQTVQDGNSESLSTGGNTRISYALQGVGNYVNGFQLLQNSGGTLVGNLRLETDNAGSPSGTLVAANSEKSNITLQDGIVTSIFFNNEITWANGTNYHLVFVVTGGTGALKGKATGTTKKVKYYDGSWKDSSNLYDLYCAVLGDNIINWAWDEVTYAEVYKLFRTESSMAYGESSLIAEGIADNEYQDKLCQPNPGEPLGEATVTRGHKKVVDIRASPNSTVQTADIYNKFVLNYNK